MERREMMPADSAALRFRLSFASVVLPLLKCAICPVCLGTFGSVVTGARLGLLANERVHGAFIVFALAANGLILAVSIRHYRRIGPLLLYAVGSPIAVFGHFGLSSEALEYAGFGILMISSLWNARLLVADHAGEACCPDHAHSAVCAQHTAQTRGAAHECC